MTLVQAQGSELLKNFNIAVVDDHKVFLRGFTLLIESLSDRYTATGFDSPVDFLLELESGTQQFDLIICDLIMNSMNGLAFIAALRNHSKWLPVLVLSGINTAPPIAEIKRLGGNGFVHKSVENSTLLEAIEALLARKPYFTNGLDNSLIENSVFSESESEDSVFTTPLPKLGARQIEVLRLIAEGATNKDISDNLNISENTVKTHLKHIFQELGVNKRTACTRKAQVMGLI